MRVRIISGMYGSRLIEAPEGNITHPMSERMRGAMFNSLGDITGKTVLDGFAGSGAIGLEALSRGAASALMIEQDRKVVDIIRGNIESLRVSDAKVIRANIFGWTDKSDQRFDIIVLDPPYDRVDPKKAVDKLKSHLTTTGIMILSHSGKAEPPRVDGVVVVETRSHAGGTLTFYQSH